MLEWEDSEEEDELGEKGNSMERGQLYIAVDNFKVDRFTSHVRRLCVAIPSNPDHPTSLRYLVSSCPGPPSLEAKQSTQSPDRATLFPISYSIPLAPPCPCPHSLTLCLPLALAYSLLSFYLRATLIIMPSSTDNITLVAPRPVRLSNFSIHLSSPHRQHPRRIASTPADSVDRFFSADSPLDDDPLIHLDPDSKSPKVSPRASPR